MGGGSVTIGTSARTQAYPWGLVPRRSLNAMESSGNAAGSNEQQWETIYDRVAAIWHRFAAIRID